MTAHQDGGATGRGFAEHVAQPADAVRVEAVGGFVQHQYARPAQQRGRESEPLPLAERVLADPPRRDPGEVGDGDRGVHSGRGQPGRRGDGPQVGPPGAGRMERRLQQRTDPARGQVGDRVPVDRGPAGVRPDQAEQDPQRGRLARAVAPDESGDAAGARGERHVVQHRDTVVPLGYADELNRHVRGR